jgi:Flp pilus assembly protein TadD
MSRTLRPALLCAVLGFLTYLPSLGGGFLYDDQHVVVDNLYIRDLRQWDVVLRHNAARPLLGLSWALNYALGGLRPWPYHLVNVLLHAANAALVASLFLWMADRWRRPDGRGAAVLGACLFAVSPMAAETVAYVSSRSTALASALGLASLRLALGALEGSRARLAGALALYVAALATKEEAAAVPLLLLMVDFLFVAGQRPRELLHRKGVHLGFLGLTVLGLVARRALTGEWLPTPALAPVRYLATQLAAFPLYFARALVPLDPALYRGHPPAPWPPDLATLAGWLLAIALAVAAVQLRRRRPEWTLAVAWLAAGLLPSSSIVALKEMVVDHRAYLGGIGVCFALGWTLWRPGRAWLMAPLVALLAARSVHYQWVLADPARAWQDATRRAPQSVEAWLALGEAYAARGNAEAQDALEHALRLDPRDARAWTNLGALHAERGRLDEAVAAMRRAARAAPGDARIRDNLGMLLQAQGRLGEARSEFEAAVAGSPPLAQPRLNLAALLIGTGELARARALVEEASRYVQDPQENEAVWALRNRLRALSP